MSEVADNRGNNRGGENPRGPRGGNHHGGLGQHQVNHDSSNFGQHQPIPAGQKDFGQAGQQQQQQPFDAHNSVYYSAGAQYSPFSGDVRNSIAAIWSRTSPSGEGFAATSGGYQGERFAASATQFAANLNFAQQSDLTMFGAGAAGAGAGDYLYGGQRGYVPPPYTPWLDYATNNGPANNVGPGANAVGQGYSCLGNNSMPAERDRLADVQHNMDGMKLAGGVAAGGNNNNQAESHNNNAANKDVNGLGAKQQQQQPPPPQQPPPQQQQLPQQSAPGKVSWASVASQPAKPQPQQQKAKKPGVLPPPSIIPSSSSVPAVPKQPVQAAPVEKPAEAAQPPPPVAGDFQGHVMTGPPPPMNHVPQQLPQQQQQPMAAHVAQQVRARQNGGPQNGGFNYNQPPPTMVAPPPMAVPPPPTMAVHPVLEGLRTANDYNPKVFDTNPKNARYFVIKSFSEDDIHRSIKYEIWCSTDHGNKRLDTAFKAQAGSGPIYLLFSVNGSGHFCGVAEMLTAVDLTPTAGGSIWLQDKFKGQFKVKWIYVKDVPNSQLRHIRLENNENKPVTNSRDTQEVPADKGRQVLKIMHNFKHATSIFDDFSHYEKRQEEEESKKAAGGKFNAADRDHNNRGGGGGGGHRGPSDDRPNNNNNNNNRRNNHRGSSDDNGDNNYRPRRGNNYFPRNN